MNSASYKKALELFEKSEYAASVEAFSYALMEVANTDEKTKVYYHRSMARYKVQDLGGALEDCNKALETLKDNADIFCHKGIILHMMEKGDEAIACFDTAAKLEPENPYRYSSRAFIKAHIKDTEGAIKDYEKALQLDPEDAVSLNNLGLLEEKKGRIDAAKEKFKRADELSGVESSNFEKPDIKGALEEWKKQEKEKEEQEKQAKQQEEETTKNVTSVKAEAIKPEPKHYWEIIKQVFTQKEVFREFVDFVMNGFKLKDGEEK